MSKYKTNGGLSSKNQILSMSWPSRHGFHNAKVCSRLLFTTVKVKAQG